MSSVMTISSILMLLSTTSLIIGWMVSNPAVKDWEKSRLFKCSYDHMGSTRVPFSIRFFLIFDIEVVLLLPTVPIFLWAPSTFSSTSGIIFIILLLSLFDEWSQGSLEWFSMK